MIRQRKPSKRVDQTVLALFAIRQVFGVSVIAVVTYLAFQVSDRRLAWVMLPFLLVYAGYGISVFVKGVVKYRRRYGGKS